MDDTLLGFVEFYNQLKGFGFIVSKNVDGSRTKFFVHKSELQNGMPMTGSTVRFIAGPTLLGRALATSLRVVVLKDSPSKTVAVDQKGGQAGAL